MCILRHLFMIYVIDSLTCYYHLLLIRDAKLQPVFTVSLKLLNLKGLHCNSNFLNLNSVPKSYSLSQCVCKRTVSVCKNVLSF